MKYISYPQCIAFSVKVVVDTFGYNKWHLYFSWPAMNPIIGPRADMLNDSHSSALSCPLPSIMLRRYIAEIVLEFLIRWSG